MTLPSEDVVASDAIDTGEFTGRLYRPFGPPPHPGVLVLHGSDPESAFPDEYARLLALHGYAALRLEYFATPETPDTLTEVPLSLFDAAIEWLRGSDTVQADRVGLVAWSRGTEAAFLAADRNEGVGALVAYSPSAYAFPAFPPTDPAKSAWATDAGPVPFVAPYDGIEDDEDEPGVVRFRRTVERASAERLDRAALPVAQIDAPVLLVAGADDRVWPSAWFAEELAERLAAADHQWSRRTCVYEDAGHAITVPYEAMSDDVLVVMGGAEDGTRYAATDAWERTLETLRDGLYP